MTSTLLLLTLSCALGQADGGEWSLTPQLATGVELVYVGTCTEQSLLPDIQYSRTYRLDNHLFVLAADAQSHEVAIMTALSVREPGEQPKYTPSSIKLELAHIDRQGGLKALGNINGPAGMPPLVEVGCFIESPVGRVGRNSVWEVPDDHRPPRTWTVLGSETCAGQMCAKLQGQQQSEDWDHPRADRTAWRRRDVVWVSLRMGVAVKVERTIERRDPARREPSHRSVTHYSLESSLRYPGKLFEDRKREVMQAKRFSDDALPIFKQPAQNTPQIDGLIRKLNYHVENTPTTPYRKAIVHLSQRLQSARKGELLLAHHETEEPVAIGPLRIGQKAPDSVLAEVGTKKNVRLSRLLGRPALVIYYNPQTKTGVETLTYAKSLAEKMGDRVSIIAMAVTTDPGFALRQQSDLQLPFTIFDGASLRVAFAVEATPRFIVLDRDGYLRASVTGWAPHIGEELIEEISRYANGMAP